MVVVVVVVVVMVVVVMVVVVVRGKERMGSSLGRQDKYYQDLHKF